MSRAIRRARHAGDEPVHVKVITYAPTAFVHCQHCEVTFQQVGIGERLRRENAATSLPEDLGREFAHLSDRVRRLVERFGPAVHISVIDAASVEGVLVSLRHRVWRYPAVVVDGRRIDNNGSAELPGVEAYVAQRLEQRGGTGTTAARSSSA
jgi:hypothetical protein